jgi:hypothetical protein
VPSADVLREQLSQAIQSSVAVVSVITQKSMSRDWVLYEAGAAWGRQLVYAPVLFKVDASEMPTVIGGYEHVLKPMSLLTRDEA